MSREESAHHHRVATRIPLGLRLGLLSTAGNRPGGPYRVEITGYEPLTPEQEKAGGTPKKLFEGYTVSVELEKKNSFADFDVPTQK